MKFKPTKKPAFRRLRAYAFDPSLSLRIDTAKINKITYAIEWEDLEFGPRGEYVEVIDYDPSIDRYYLPVDLNDRHILAESGLTPSESNPQFHQQMVYAVAMVTIQNFEQALGRKIIWSPRLLEDEIAYEEYVPRLRIYPHALREANAFYSPYRKALLFGYFSSTPANTAVHMPNSVVFTCLSHDIITHEVTHAILDGIHRDYNDPTNPDVLAFHEAFSDLIALFQHFTYPDVLKFEIAKTKGDLSSENLLGKLAQELGSAIGGYGSLRDAIGETDPVTKKWKSKNPNPDDYQTIMEPHARGSLLVAAIFEVFLTIYKSRVSDLLRIASNGTGILPQGELHPDLVNRLANEAAKSAKHILNMCIRALDYCPPVDLTFGDYLRAIITADLDLLKNDQHEYRLAFIDAFRKRGIYPEDIKTLSVESLNYKRLDIELHYLKDVNQLDTDTMTSNVDMSDFDETTKHLLAVIYEFLEDYAGKIQYVNDRKEIYDITRKYVGGGLNQNSEFETGLHNRIGFKFSNSLSFSKLTGLIFTADYKKLGLKKSNMTNSSSFQIQNLRKVSRVGPDGVQINQIVFSILQKSGCIIKDGKFVKYSEPPIDGNVSKVNYFEFSGGCTLIFDLDNKKLKYVISKPLLDMEKLEQEGEFDIDKKKIIAQHQYQNKDMALHMGEDQKYFGNKALDFKFTEPFAFLHQH